MWQMGGLGPMLGQAHHFLQYAPVDIPYGKERYGNEANRLYGVMDRQLAKTRYLAGEDYSIADIAAWPWTRTPDRQNVKREDYPNFVRWFDEIAARPAVQAGVKVLAESRRAQLERRPLGRIFPPRGRRFFIACRLRDRCSAPRDHFLDHLCRRCCGSVLCRVGTKLSPHRCLTLRFSRVEISA